MARRTNIRSAVGQTGLRPVGRRAYRPLLTTLGLLAALLGAVAPSASVGAEPAATEARRSAARTTFSDAEIAAGFFKIAFGAELHRAGRVDVIRKYDGPIRIHIDDRGRPDRRGAVLKTVADIKKHIAGLDIDVASERAAANFHVTLVRERDFPRAIRQIYGEGAARRILKSLEPQCLSGFRKDTAFRITRSEVILVTDVDDFTFYDCAYEEMLQALGPINDDASVPWSMFNDDVQMGYFDVYDQYLLNILYHPRIRPGMTRDEVRRLMPDILPAVRAWVTAVNGLAR